MAPSLWKGLVGIGLFALAHAAFSAAQHSSSDTSGLCSYLLWYSSYCRGV
uniref:Membrane magnesium transporter 1 n=2 Tax=Laurasiatheria TaxID=314145 RepID=A0AC11E9B4_SHEEP